MLSGQIAEQPDVARLYQKRCTQRRIEPKDDKVACPQRCGNLTCSRLGDGTASCETCSFRFCVQCESRNHPEQPDCILFLEKQLEEGQREERQQQDIQQRLQTMKKLREEGNVRLCPRCKFPYQKAFG